jgi:hypothetical protein
MNSLLLASSFLHSTTNPPRLEDAYADLYEGPRTGLKDTLRMGAALGAILIYAGLLALI